MKAEEFNEMPLSDARDKFNKYGLKVLIKQSGEFYRYFFNYGIHLSEFKERLSILVENGLDLNQKICESWTEKKAPIFESLSSSFIKASSMLFLMELKKMEL